MENRIVRNYLFYCNLCNLHIHLPPPFFFFVVKHEKMLKKKETRGRDLIFSIQAAADRDNMYIKNQL